LLVDPWAGLLTEFRTADVAMSDAVAPRQVLGLLSGEDAGRNHYLPMLGAAHVLVVDAVAPRQVAVALRRRSGCGLRPQIRVGGDAEYDAKEKHDGDQQSLFHRFLPTFG